MPTAAKLVSALAFALVGLWAALAYIPQLPEGTDTGQFPLIMAVLGLVLGWRSMGRNAGRGWGESAGYGLRTSVLIVVWALFGFAVYSMLMRSTRQLYRGDPGRAVMDVPDIMLQYGRLLIAQEVLVALIVGGLVGGILAEFAARRST